jgi:hypothetical protein
MALPPTVENLWITVGIPLFSVGNQGGAGSLLLTRQRSGAALDLLSTEVWWLPTSSPQVFIER